MGKLIDSTLVLPDDHAKREQGRSGWRATADEEVRSYRVPIPHHAVGGGG